MERYGYEIIGEDYTEESLRKRIKESKVKELIDTSNERIKSSKGYTHWARKKNLKILSNTLLKMRNQNINSLYSLENTIEENIKKLQDIQDKIKIYENKYKNALKFLKQYYSKMPNKKYILKKLKIPEHKKKYS